LPEELLGYGVGTLAAALILGGMGRLPLIISLLLSCGAFVFTEIRSDSFADTIPAQFNWYPLRYHLPLGLMGLPSIFEQLFPGVLIGWASSAVSLERRLDVAIVGGVCGAVGVLSLEFYQQSLPGRTPDITQVMLFLAGWVMASIANYRMYARTKG
jgi:hypothetical protein